MKQLTKEQIRAKVKQGKEAREKEKKRLMKLPKNEIIELYLNLRYDDKMLDEIHLPTYRRGLTHDIALLENQEKSAKQRFENNIAAFKQLLKTHKLEVTEKTTASRILKILSEKAENVPDIKSIQAYVLAIQTENIKGS